VAPPAKGPRKPAAPEPVPVRLPITLGQFLKVAALAASGGEAKAVIAQGWVRVNGEAETRRGRKLAPGDVVQFGTGVAQVAVIDGAARGATTDASAGASTNAAS
jgi:ribosome-associated protein